MVEEVQGGCMCGKVRYTVRIEDDDAYLCHCRMCQRASGNISLAMKSVKEEDVSWEHAPDYYQSSPFARRGFCSSCGTSLTFEFTQGGRGKMDLILGTFDDPGRFEPKHHFGVESMHRQWLNTEGLPEKRSEDHAILVDLWMKTVGKLPD